MFFPFSFSVPAPMPVHVVVVCSTSCVLLVLFSLWHWRHVNDASVSATSLPPHTHISYTILLSTRAHLLRPALFCPLSFPPPTPPRGLRSCFTIYLMKLFACIINSFWYFTFNLTIINWMCLSVTECARICFCFGFAFLFLVPNCIRFSLGDRLRPPVASSKVACHGWVCVRVCTCECVLVRSDIKRGSDLTFSLTVRHTPHGTQQC